MPSNVPPVECERHHPSLYVSDLAAAVEFYTDKLAFRLAFRWGTPPTMAGLNLGEVQIFLEKRLAALLRDLAAHKRMSLDSCLEEILLHTCEPLGNGVASPHTKGQLRFIQELKKKHGIDYDSHASYRFVEK
jgi:glyoxalase/bleomycin resistance protein/dioxygenase superfamily protein